MKKYEYKIVSEAVLLDWKNKVSPTDQLNKLGQDGWSAVTEFASGRSLIFMREIPAPAASAGKRSYSGSRENS